MARGIWDKDTQPIMIITDKKVNLKEKIKPAFTIFGLSEEMKKFINTKIDYSKGYVMKEHSSGPIL